MIHLNQGNTSLGLDELHRAAADFADLDMNADAGRVLLELVEELLSNEAWSRAAMACRQLVDTFVRLGATPRSMDALGYLQKAVADESAPLSLVRRVREFVIADDPELRFEPSGDAP